MDTKSYRFRESRFRIFNRETKKMYYSTESNLAFILSKDNFLVTRILEDGSMDPIPLADSSNSVWMEAAYWRDDFSTDMYEGDVVFTRRVMNGRQIFPICGIINAKDFTYSINSGVSRFTLDYGDKNTQVLGNIFQTSDEDLAAKAKDLFEKWPVK